MRIHNSTKAATFFGVVGGLGAVAAGVCLLVLKNQTNVEKILTIAGGGVALGVTVIALIVGCVKARQRALLPRDAVERDRREEQPQQPGTSRV